MQYDRFELTVREYEAERARAIRQHQLITAATCVRQAQQLPSPLRGWWLQLCSWVTILRSCRAPAVQPIEDTSLS